MFQYVLVIQGNCCISRCSSWALFTDTVSQCQIVVVHIDYDRFIYGFMVTFLVAKG